MKKIFICLFVIFQFSALAQLKKDDQNGLYYEEIIETDLSQIELKKYLNKWVAGYYKNTNNAIQYNDDEIMAHSSFKTTFLSRNGLYNCCQKVNANFSFLLTISLKDKRYRFRFSNIEGTSENALAWSELIYSLIFPSEDIEEFKKKYIEFSKTKAFPKWYQKVILKKRVNNSRKLNKDWEHQKRQHEHIKNNLENYFRDIVKSSKKNIEYKVNDDW